MTPATTPDLGLALTLGHALNTAAAARDLPARWSAELFGVWVYPVPGGRLVALEPGWGPYTGRRFTMRVWKDAATRDAVPAGDPLAQFIRDAAATGFDLSDRAARTDTTDPVTLAAWAAALKGLGEWAAGVAALAPDLPA